MDLSNRAPFKDTETRTQSGRPHGNDDVRRINEAAWEGMWAHWEINIAKKKIISFGHMAYHDRIMKD